MGWAPVLQMQSAALIPRMGTLKGITPSQAQEMTDLIATFQWGEKLAVNWPRAINEQLCLNIGGGAQGVGIGRHKLQEVSILSELSS